MPEPTTADDATERFLLFEAVADLLRRIAGDDVLVVMLDDLHWAEPTALSLLRHLTRSLGDAPVLLVASHRASAEYVTDPLREALADLYRDEARRISLRGFDDAELSDLVALEAGADAPAIAARLRDDSAGNPLYATQLIRHWVESGRIERELDTVRWAADPRSGDVPPSLREVVWSRVGALGHDTATVLAAGAVLGVEFDDDVLRALVELDECDGRPCARRRDRLRVAARGPTAGHEDALRARVGRRRAVLRVAAPPAPANARAGGAGARTGPGRTAAEDRRAARPPLRVGRPPRRCHALGDGCR